jgi:phage baseplate assembly protein W
MPQPTLYQTSTVGATWIDTNTRFTLNNLPDRLPDEMSITYSSLVNLFTCQIGERGKTFQPEYGCELYALLQEPIDAITATRIRIGLIQAIGRWEPRIALDYGQTSVTENIMIPGYEIRIVGTCTITSAPIDLRFNQKAGA